MRCANCKKVLPRTGIIAVFTYWAEDEHFDGPALRYCDMECLREHVNRLVGD